MHTERPAETEPLRRFTIPVGDYCKAMAIFDILEIWLLVLPDEYRKHTFKLTMTYTFQIIAY
jgi:hypothetical protein